MVDIADIQKVNMLYAATRNIEAALDAFDHGATIVGMTVGSKPPEDQIGPPIGILVDTSRMQPPPAMIDTVKGNMRQRVQEIAQELAALGVTGAEERR